VTGVATAPRPLMMLRLIAGRGSFRLAVQVMAVVLLAAWGAQAYGPFANAFGACSAVAEPPASTT